MPKKKNLRIFITLECTSCKENKNKRSIGISRYLTSKNKNVNPTKLVLKKYCSFCNTRTIHKEIK